MNDAFYQASLEAIRDEIFFATLVLGLPQPTLTEVAELFITYCAGKEL